MTEHILHAGPFEMIYQEGFIRKVTLGGEEVLRMMYFALRDENWWTYPHTLVNERISEFKDHFNIEYDCYHDKDGKKVLQWKGRLIGSKEGVITFEIEGTVLESVLKNRAGFCVLHPIRGLAGEPCLIDHPDGSQTASQFPRWVDPNNPFKEVVSMHWQAASKKIHIHFKGDLFETEDQRNWTDASFKTFCTPLSIPFPVMITKGQTIYQRISLSIAPGDDLTIKKKSDPAKKANRRMPAIGIAASSETQDLTEQTIRLLQTLKFSHYRLDVNLVANGWKDKLALDCLNARKLHIPLELVLTFPDGSLARFDQFQEIMAKADLNVKQILLLTQNKLTTAQALIDFTPHIRDFFPDSKIGAGTDYNFTELNRNRFDASLLDFISFAIQPQEHAFDDRSIMENTEAHLDVVQSAAQLYPGKDIHISPITLRKRYNPYATDPAFRILTTEQRSDPRQKEEFCSSFTAASLSQLSDAGAASVTLFQTVGNQGIMSTDGKRYPIYDFLKKILS